MAQSPPLPIQKTIASGKLAGRSKGHIAGLVAAMTESKPRMKSERTFHHAHGEPGQPHEVGKRFGGSV
jgi:hypothetical protein